MLMHRWWAKAIYIFGLLYVQQQVFPSDSTPLFLWTGSLIALFTLNDIRLGAPS